MGGMRIILFDLIADLLCRIHRYLTASFQRRGRPEEVGIVLIRADRIDALRSALDHIIFVRIGRSDIGFRRV